MKRIILLVLLCSLIFHFHSLSAQNHSYKKSITGSWLGSLDVNSIKLRLVFNIKLNDKDSLTASMDSPDQGAKNIPMGSVILKSDSLIIQAPLLLGNYKGAVKNDSTIEGQWTQSGRSFKLDLRKLRAAFTVNRPQEPKPPFPYASEEVTFGNKKFNIFLAGTLTIPEGKGPFPAVILITGSGAQNRDEALMGHKPFLVIADWLSRNGIAVLRYDDRGVGKSQGNYATATSADLATDAEAAYLFLKNNPRINPTAIGLIGHSEGGLIAPITVVSNPGIAFIVSLAGPGVTGDQILFRQQADFARLSGAKEEDIAEGIEVNKKLFAILKKEKDNMKAEAKITETYRKILTDKKLPPEDIEKGIVQLNTTFGVQTYTWYRYFISTDPASYWKKVKCPVIALNGEKDLQVAADVNLPAIDKALKAGGNKNVKTVKLPELNHLFQHCTTGLPAEYGQIEETFSPEALKIISDWILGLKGSL
jgi:pimeloyl-ACP methyl ester carboxylesterase